VRKKGFEYLVDAVGRLPPDSPIIAAVAGDGDLRDELPARARRAGAGDRIRFLGNSTQDEIARLLAAADIVAVPSVRDDSGNVDGLPNVVLEALASGTPLVATPAGGIGSMLEPDRTAVVVPERDAGALASALLRLAADPVLRARLGQAARALVAERFGWSRTARQFDGAYRRALAK
jgi:glycosyltransferase involved in cell wall biosynthesis